MFCLPQHLGCNLEEPEELQEMVCEGCMNKAPFLWTYAAHFAGNTLLNLACQVQYNQCHILGHPDPNPKNCLSICVWSVGPPIISGSVSEKDKNNGAQEGTQSENNSHNNEEKPSNGLEQTNPEVRNGESSLKMCWHV